MVATSTIEYTDLKDRVLAQRLAEEDDAELSGRVAPGTRITCYLHMRWLHQCISSPDHVDRAIGYRWCRACRFEMEIAVDEVGRSARLRCPGCSRGAMYPLDYQLVSCCVMSMYAAKMAREGAERR